MAAQLGWGLIFAFLASILAYRFRLLTLHGAMAAFFLGGVVFGLGGWDWALLLIAFFISSSTWSLVFRRQKKQAEKMYAKGATRDAGQVLANGGVAGLFVVLHLVFPQSIMPWAGFCAALAAANADTWATELGVLNRKNPRLIVSGREVAPGTSGAVSLAGTLAALAGAALIALLAWLLDHTGTGLWLLFLITFSGLAGSLVDSLFGAAWQAVYYCPECKKETERHPYHICEAGTKLIRGKAWLNNDWVNLFCTLGSSTITVLFSAFL